MSNDQILSILEKYRDILEIDSVFSWALREMGWKFIQVLMWAVDGVEKVTDSIITLGGFFNYGPVNKFIVSFRPVLWALLAISLTFLGYQIASNKIKNRADIVTNIILALSFVVILPSLMTNFNNIVKEGVNAVSPTDQATASAQIVKSNLADIYYYAKKDFNVKPPSKGLVNDIPLNKIKYIDIAETIDKDNKNIKNDVLKYKLKEDEDGKTYVDELGNGFLGFGEESYYRYHLNFITVIVSLVTTLIALAITSIKLGKIVFELAFHKLFGMIIAVTDISGGQRTKQVLSTILSSFAVIFFISVLLKLYIYFSSWTATLSYGKAGTIGSMLLLIAGSFALIDGPNIVERILGIDAGLKSGWQALAGTYYSIKAAKNGLSAVKNTASNVAGNSVKAVGGAVGMVQGFRNGRNSVLNPPMQDMMRNAKNLGNGSMMPGIQKVSGLNQKPLSSLKTDNIGNKPSDLNRNLNNKAMVVRGKRDNISSNLARGMADSLNMGNSLNKGLDDNTGINMGNHNLDNDLLKGIQASSMSDSSKPLIYGPDGNPLRPSSELQDSIDSMVSSGQTHDGQAGDNLGATPNLSNEQLNEQRGNLNDGPSANSAEISTMTGQMGDGTSAGLFHAQSGFNRNVLGPNPGHIYPQHQYTIAGQNKFVQEMKKTYAKAYNTGYNLGQKFGKPGLNGSEGDK